MFEFFENLPKEEKAAAMVVFLGLMGFAVHVGRWAARVHAQVQAVHQVARP